MTLQEVHSTVADIRSDPSNPRDGWKMKAAVIECAKKRKAQTERQEDILCGPRIPSTALSLHLYPSLTCITCGRQTI